VRPKPLEIIGALLLLLIRGTLLWFLIPLAALVWMLTLEWARRKGASLGAFLGWMDINMNFLLGRGPLRPFFRGLTFTWVPFAERAGVTHRIGKWDLV